MMRASAGREWKYIVQYWRYGLYVEMCMLCLCAFVGFVLNLFVLAIKPMLCTHTHTRTLTELGVCSYTVMYCLERGFGLRGDVLLTVLCNTHSLPHTHLEVTGRVERSVSRQGRI